METKISSKREKGNWSKMSVQSKKESREVQNKSDS